MIDCLIKEIDLSQSHLEGNVETIYFGGGTPSVLTSDEIHTLLERVKENWKVLPNAEITMEVNPDDLSADYLSVLHRSGINRLSIGIQSFNDSVLKLSNRSHNSEQAKRAIIEAQNVGFENISADLIFGLPGSSQQTLLSDLQQLMLANPQHISVYCFTLEEKTVFNHRYEKGEIIVLPEDDEAEQFEIIIEFLEKQGYLHYEISNFSKPGYESKHNRSYWEGKHYLGIGPSAHSFINNQRWANINNNGQYMKMIENNEAPATLEEESPFDRYNEYIFTSLRTSEGINLNFIKSKWNTDLKEECARELQRYRDNDYLIIEDNRVKLLKKGKLIADKIAADLFRVSE